MRSRFAEVAPVVVSLMGAGASFDQACVDAGVSRNTVLSWLKRGRKEDGTVHAAFAAEVAEARDLGVPSVERMTAGEFEGELARAIRKGSVQAMKLYWEINKRADQDPPEVQEPADPLDGADELAKRRERRAA